MCGRVTPWGWLVTRGVTVGFMWSMLQVASADVSIPRVADGAGVRMGPRATFHGGAALIAGIDTNVFRETSSERPRTAAYVHPTAWLGVGNRPLRDGLLMTPLQRSARVVDYHISVLAGYRQYLAPDVKIRSQPRFSIGSQIRVIVLPARKVSFEIREDFFRGADPGNYEADGRLFNFNRIDHRGWLNFVLRPGGGRLSIANAYHNEVLYFGEPELQSSNRMIHGLDHETKWRILAKSAIVFSYDFDWTDYVSCCDVVGRGRNEDNFAHRIEGGFRGQVGKRFALEGVAGWGLGYYRKDPDGPSFSSFIGHATVTFYPALDSCVYASIFRRFSDSLFGNYVLDHGLSLGGSYRFPWRMRADLTVGLRGRHYEGLPEPGQDDADLAGYDGEGADSRQLQTRLVTVGAKLEQPLGRFVSIGIGYNLDLDTAKLTVLYTNGGQNELGYIKHLAWALVAIRI